MLKEISFWIGIQNFFYRTFCISTAQDEIWSNFDFTPHPPLPPYYSLNANLIKQANFNLHTLNNKEPLATLRFILKWLEAEISPLNKPLMKSIIKYLRLYSKKCKRLAKGKPLTPLPNYMKYLAPFFTQSIRP